ncbi:MAG: hypothetical protein RLZZ507_2914 [Cyanobacteriota bacterium]|jgi:hypothetical protein
MNIHLMTDAEKSILSVIFLNNVDCLRIIFPPLGTKLVQVFSSLNIYLLVAPISLSFDLFINNLISIHLPV